MVNGAILAMARTIRFFVSEFVSHIGLSFETPGTTTVCKKHTYTLFILSETETCSEFMFPCFPRNPHCSPKVLLVFFNLCHRMPIAQKSLTFSHQS